MDQRIKSAQADWEEAQEKYGAFEVVDNPSDLTEVDSRRVWTEFWTKDQFITNIYLEVEDFDGEITSYYVFERPYNEPEESIRLTTTFWDDCESCDGAGNDCAECDGRGSIPLDVL